ncbi:heparinase II/III family protein [Blautia schinkii]|nr:heparinase II/III family protein [Blautia schinkii]
MREADFFQNCLNLEYKGMETVKKAVDTKDYETAKKEFASYIRRTLEPERFFAVPYEEPENAYLRSKETVEEACERIVSNHVMVSVGIPCDFGENGEIDWCANPTYNGYEEWTWQLNRHPEWKMLAHEYRRTGDERFARRTAEMFESWYHRAIYPEDVSGEDTECWRTIECGIRMGANWPYTLFTFYNTDAFTDQVLTDWYISVWEHGERLCKNCTDGNWLIMEMNGLAHIGILYPQLAQSEEWLEMAFSRLEAEIERQFYPDGFQYELSTIYHEVAVNNYQRLLEMAKAFDVPVPEGILEKLKNAALINVKLMMPDGRIPNINDGEWFSSKLLLKRKSRIFPDVPEFEWVLSDGTAGREPEYQSLALEFSGLMIMRNGWGKDAVWAMMDGAPFGRGHQHEDKLSVLIYAGGKVLLTEGGNYAYDDSEMRKYVLSTRAHNTVMADGHGQNRRRDYHWEEGDILKKSDLLWNIGDNFDYAESSYQEGYGPEVDKSIRNNRRIYFVKKTPKGILPFFIVIDRLSADKEHLYEILWHVNSGNPQISHNGIEFDEIKICMSGRNLDVEVVCAQEKPVWQGFVALGQRQGDYIPVNCVIAGTKADNTRIVTVLAPHEAGNPGVAEVEAGTDPADDTVTVVLADGSRLCFTEKEMMQNR